MTDTTTDLNVILKHLEGIATLNDRSAIKLEHIDKRIKESLGMDIFLLKEVMDFTDSKELMLRAAIKLLKEILNNRTDDTLLLTEISKEAA